MYLLVNLGFEVFHMVKLNFIYLCTQCDYTTTIWIRNSKKLFIAQLEVQRMNLPRLWWCLTARVGKGRYSSMHFCEQSKNYPRILRFVIDGISNNWIIAVGSVRIRMWQTYTYDKVFE